MIRSDAALRRYTPPTCTLEVVATESPLSRWAGRSVWQRLRFQLSLETPQSADQPELIIRGNRAELEALHTAVEAYVQGFLAREPGTGLMSSGSDPGALGIGLQPLNALSHQLILGPLATPDSGPTIRLSTLQLADLATALDEFAAEGITLPNLNAANTRSTPSWFRIAAVAVAAIGISTATIHYFDRNQSGLQLETASQPTAPSPEPASPSPTAIAPATPTPKASSTPFPPPMPFTVALTPATPKASAPSRTATNQAPPNQTSAAQPRSTPPTASSSQPQRPAFTKLPRSVKPQAPEIALIPAPGSSQAAPAPTATLNANGAAAGTEANAIARRSRAIGSQAEGTAISPEAPATNQATRADSLSANRTAFDVLPQVAEVRQYFQQRWQAPADLTGVLEYQLFLAPDGSLQRLEPIGQRASIYLSHPALPKPGEILTAPITSGRSLQIRLVLWPDGKVQTFLESFVTP